MSDAKAVKPCFNCGSTDCDIRLECFEGEISKAVWYCHACGVEKSFKTLQGAFHFWLEIEDGKIPVSAGERFWIEEVK